MPCPSNRNAKPNYKLLHQTHVRLRNRFGAAQYTLSNLQTRGAPNGHTNTIYCLQLYTYPATGKQVLFTGSKDRTIREWDLQSGAVIRILENAHESSVLSICVARGLLASASSDRRVVVWDLARSQVIKVIRDHEDSVLCVRFDEKRLVSCSKGKPRYFFASALVLGSAWPVVPCISSFSFSGAWGRLGVGLGACCSTMISGF